jgi:hypothetical protein
MRDNELWAIARHLLASFQRNRSPLAAQPDLLCIADFAVQSSVKQEPSLEYVSAPVWTVVKIALLEIDADLHEVVALSTRAKTITTRRDCLAIDLVDSADRLRPLISSADATDEAARAGRACVMPGSEM